MPGRPPKSYLQLVTEKKSHRTKSELKAREKAEQDLLTGISLKEWPDTKSNPVAHKKFTRIKRLLRAIKKDDALYEPVINRYCLLHAECKQFDDMKTRLFGEFKELAEAKDNGEIDFMQYLEEKNKLQDRIMACDRKVMDKRKMLLSIEKENIMTIQSVLRSIPKKEQPKQESKMAAFLERRKAKQDAT